MSVDFFVCLRNAFCFCCFLFLVATIWAGREWKPLSINTLVTVFNTLDATKMLQNYHDCWNSGWDNLQGRVIGGAEHMGLWHVKIQTPNGSTHFIPCLTLKVNENYKPGPRNTWIVSMKGINQLDGNGNDSDSDSDNNDPRALNQLKSLLKNPINNFQAMKPLIEQLAATVNSNDEDMSNNSSQYYNNVGASTNVSNKE